MAESSTADGTLRSALLQQRPRVAVDGRRLQDEPLGGVGRWIANLLPYLAANADLVLFTDARRRPIGGDYEQVALRAPAHAPETFWLQVNAARWLRRFDGIVHGTFNMLPLFVRQPSVVTIYDLAPRQHKEDQTVGKQLAWRSLTRLAAHKARCIITISGFSRDAIIELYGIEPDKVSIARPAVDPVFRPDRAADAPELVERLGVCGPYVVALGGARRRGLDVACRAWQRARVAGVAEELVVVGPEAPPRAPGIYHVGRLHDDEWATVLAGAAAFCYPTRYEGYGMPALEAAASGTPVLAAPVGPLPEVLRNAAEWVAEPTVRSVADGLITLLSDRDRARDRRDAGLELAKNAPSWQQAAEAVLDAYRIAGGV